MNIFYIPSWYPNQNDPIYGIFIKEEIELIAKHNPNLNLAVSTWGQGDEDFLLWAGKPLSSLKKVLRWLSANKTEVFQNSYFHSLSNIKFYHNPTFTWTRKILKGNRNSIIQANRKNLTQAIQELGHIDLIHVYASYPGSIIAHQLSKETGIPYIITSHMSPFPFDEFLDSSGKIVDWLAEPIQNASAIIATSQSAKLDIEKYGFEVSSVIPIARDLDLFTIDTSIPKSENFTFLAVGRLVPQKGFDLLLKAFSKLEGNYRLRIVGEGEDRPMLEKMIREMGLEETVTLTGALDRNSVIKEMQSCDVFVLSSRHETFGNVVVEAAACGKPVIATKCGGPEDIISDDIGVLVEKNSVEDLYDAMVKASNLKRSLIPEKIRDLLISEFDDSVICKRICDLYFRVGLST